MAGIKKAEVLSENGATKKELVLCWAIETARQLGVRRSKAQLDNDIEEYIELTKEVNPRTKDIVAKEVEEAKQQIG